MPKLIIKENQNTAVKSGFDVKTRSVFVSPELAIRNRRSQKYIDAVKELDIGGHNISQNKIDEMVNAIKEELPEVAMSENLIGIVSKCYLGVPYEVHTLSIIGNCIITHYKENESLPSELEKARNLANNSAYIFIEVYKSKLVAVKNDGSVSVVESKKGDQ